MTFKAALITGGAHRLGRAMAEALGARGIAVGVHYATRAKEAQDTVAAITRSGGCAVAVQADLMDIDQTQNLVSKAAEALEQPLDILINNASIFERDTIKTLSVQSWEHHVNCNLRAAVFLTQAFAKQLPTSKKNPTKMPPGCIINMIDQRVRKLTPEFMTYTLAKAGLWTFTQTAAQALAPSIRVNAIGPGSTLKASRQSEQHFNAQRQASILQKGPDLIDITTTLHYLLDASSVTGQLICVDGGQHLGWKTPDIIDV